MCLATNISSPWSSNFIYLRWTNEREKVTFWFEQRRRRIFLINDNDEKINDQILREEKESIEQCKQTSEQQRARGHAHTLKRSERQRRVVAFRSFARAFVLLRSLFLNGYSSGQMVILYRATSFCMCFSIRTNNQHLINFKLRNHFIVLYIDRFDDQKRCFTEA